MREHFHHIYQDHAQRYDQLVTREDKAQQLSATLQSICPLDGLDVVEWGAGTGRVTRLLAPYARQIHAFDQAAPMLEVARERLPAPWQEKVHFAVSSHHPIPLDDDCADLAIEGWSFAHLAEELPAAEGAAAVQRAIDEMDRIVRPGGHLLLIETLGTGHTTPTPPSPTLAALYTYFEQTGFQRHHCRTDYQFETLEEAEALITFFFGAKRLDSLDREALTLPECTGIWHRSA